MIIEQEQLLSMTGYKNVADAEKCLKKQGISLIYGKGGRISTTLEALNSTLLKKDNDSGSSGKHIEID